ncbi:hypothetical protein SAMN04488540_11047 [Ferrimonas sediminum]|uniref:Uncharacterized protein n=1 Tax=Ferrimonas sediminum TaxID=718193 RepID=A0A1G8UZ91_9GAMM|nr:hypothetical protein [Ferrimonas sediminum]SDJ59162.1 hypothetical protein SAMN04488540_11047 [Ferrimonas sediminum]
MNISASTVSYAAVRLPGTDTPPKEALQDNKEVILAVTARQQQQATVDAYLTSAGVNQDDGGEVSQAMAFADSVRRAEALAQIDQHYTPRSADPVAEQYYPSEPVSGRYLSDEV